MLKPRTRYVFVTAAGLLTALALSAGAQDGPAVSDPNPADCSNGTFVADPAADPGLVSDCLALVGVRNHWVRHPDNAELPAGHPLLTWGYGDAARITAWNGIHIHDRRVDSILLARRGISGAIPPQLGRLTNLKWLDLNGNQLTGPIPTELSRLTNLESLDLNGNQLTGPIPTELNRLTNLRSLDLHNNLLTGSIPSELGRLTNLESLDLNGNQLTGPIPTELNRLTNLRSLDLHNNQLTGPIPTELGQLTNLVYLRLNSNQLTGSIPSELGRLANLRDLAMADNQLTGTIPSELSQLATLGQLSLLPNNFELSGIDDLPEMIRDLFPFRFDEGLGLIAIPENATIDTLGTRKWSVHQCEVNGSLNLNMLRITSRLNGELTQYFRWLSNGKYIPEFTVGSSIQGKDTQETGNDFELFSDCSSKLREKFSSDENEQRNFIIVTNEEGASGLGSDNIVMVQGSSVRATDNFPEPALTTVAHEMGHVLGFPHSYGGLNEPTASSEGSGATGADEGDNPMDIMSGGGTGAPTIGTIAVNRYAAGWIDPEDVVVHQGPAAVYQLSPMDEDGNQMLIVPTSHGPGLFYTLGVRTAEDYDRDIPKEGIEAYRIDQRPSACEHNRPGVCLGASRRTQPTPPPPRGNSSSTAHVYEAGDSFELGGIRIEIRERRDNRFTIWVDDNTLLPTPAPAPPEPNPPPQECTAYNGRFCDDDDNTHEPNIETIADWGITQGCGNNRYCPENSITRQQMAAFLHRAATHRSGAEPAATDAPTLNDVEEGTRYRRYAQWAVAAGIMQAPEGQFNPGGTVTRADMAEMITAAFDHIIPPAAAQGIFADMTGQPDTATRAAEALRTAGITAGCSTSPLRFCPDRPVTRSQMASFFARALSSIRAR